ncbi:hypothetical protein J1N35_006961 [Gossypium stocksii]|uniref:Uncharacterized protein n=1 Tax=Gossypium stocksii TaxID=47602 RepID=A0A9D3W7N0_9ROSI|nr:hypothetical protein J1N35_006961 [Gossypium stocksii]
MPRLHQIRFLAAFLAAFGPKTQQKLYISGANRKTLQKAASHFWPTTERCHSERVRAAVRKLNVVEDNIVQMVAIIDDSVLLGIHECLAKEEFPKGTPSQANKPEREPVIDTGDISKQSEGRSTSSTVTSSPFNQLLLPAPPATIGSTQAAI